MLRGEISTGPDVALCPVCRCQLPPWNSERNLPFCQMRDHWESARQEADR